MDTKLYVVYMHTSPVNKSYIGQTSNYIYRTKCHATSRQNSPFYQAIKKYGFDNFSSTILKVDLTVEEANYWESFFIKQFNTIHPNGYNLTSGGKNYEVSNLTRTKQSLVTKGRRWSVESKQKHSEARQGEKNNRFGSKHSEQTKQQMRTSSIGKNLGRVLTEEHKAKISKKLKGRNMGAVQHIITCPYCGRSGGNTMHRWHFDRCKFKLEL